mmetsp:Transcript_10611/g.24144  ORF Transcript_10611/g.24144 Transcript_10611/m.24144 type:complete len:315 (-) Transcript_10611:213-1157(-)
MMEIDEGFEELERRFQRQYEMIEKSVLGEGTYGKVYMARNTSNGDIVAMKQMKIDAQEEGVPSTAIREIALLKELNHPNVVKLLDVFCKPGKMVLVFEYAENDLKKYMKALNNRLPPATIKNFAFQLCTGIAICHSNRIIHRDIKPQNLLIDGRMCLKLADFGLARAFTVPLPKYTHEVITVWYRPPEILLGAEKYSIPVDLWSIGCVLAEMATGGPLFAGDSEIDTIFKIFQKLGTPNEAHWPGIKELPYFKPTFPAWKPKGWAAIRNTLAQVGTEGVDLLEKMMRYDPSKRISATAAREHAYFADLDKANIC